MGLINTLAAVDATVETAVTGGFSDIQNLILTVIAVAAFGLVVAVLGIKVGMKWLKKQAASA